MTTGPIGREAAAPPPAEAEDTLRRIATLVPGVLYQFRLCADGTSAFPYASEGIWEVYRVRPEEVRLDATAAWGRLHADDREAVRDAVERSAASLAPWRQTYRVVLPGRGVRWLHGEATPEREPDGATLWHGYITDVTEAVAREAALREAKEAAERASRAKSTFLANMSHEIRTPMNGVLGAAELLGATELTPDQRELVATVAGSAESLLAIINDILDFSRVEAGRVLLERVPFDLGRLVRGAFVPFHARLAAGRVQLEATVEPGLAPERLGDPARLRQVLVNLVGNALKFTERGRVALEVRAGAEGDDVVFEVQDTGIGIPDDRRGALFEPFEQVDASTSRRFGGTGLGLAISRRLVETMGGRIGVESVLGQGSTFTVTVPLPPAPPGSVSPSLVAPLPVHALHRLRVLLAEDNPVNQRIACRMLERLGAEVTVVPDGAAAVEAARVEPRPDVILMDVQMPGVDGYEATARIRADEAREGVRRVPVFALTANAMPADRARALAADMDDHLAKPVRLAALEALLERVRPSG